MLIESEADIIKVGRQAIALVNMMTELGVDGCAPLVTDLVDWYRDMENDPDLTCIESGRIMIKRVDSYAMYEMYVNVS